MEDQMERRVVQYLGPGGELSQKLEEYEERPEQLQMARAVCRALRAGEFLIVEAGTGTGKSLAYLLPALLSRQKVIISTGTKNLQEQLMSKDLPVLRRHFPAKIALMKGRANYLCWARFEAFSQQPLFPYRQEIEHFAEIVKWARKTKTGDRAEIPDLPDDYRTWRELSASAEQCLGSKCGFFTRCFITRMRGLAQEADIVVVNHHLFLADLAVRCRGYGEVIPRARTVIFDEAHELWEAATEYFGFHVSDWRIEDLIRDAQRDPGLSSLDQETLRQVYKTLQGLHELSARFFAVLQNSPPEGAGGKHGSPASREEGLRFRLPAELGQEQLAHQGTELLAVLEALRGRFTELGREAETVHQLAVRAGVLKEELSFILAQADPNYVYWGELRPRSKAVHASLIMPGELLREHLYQELDSAVFTSATLAVQQGGQWSFAYFKRGLGLEDLDRQTQELRLASSFDYTRQAILYLPPTMPDPADERFPFLAAQHMAALLEISQGRAFLLFTSFRNLNLVYQELAPKLPYTVLRQGEAPKPVLLEQFREDEHSVLFATASFWQGVDVPGPALSCVIIDKLPFASPTDPLTEARIEYINRQTGNAFMEYQVPQAVIALRQGLGRLIRTQRDRGVLAVLDPRLKTKRYGATFLRSLPAMTHTSDLNEVRAFFQKAAKS